MRTVMCVGLLLILTALPFAQAEGGTLRISGDNAWQAFVDGEMVAEGNNWQAPTVTPFELDNGRAVIAIYVHDAEPGAAGRGGMLADIILDDGTYICTSDAEGDPDDTWPGWKCDSGDPVDDRKDGWEKPDFDDSGWEELQEYEQFGAGIWGFGAGAMRAVMGDPESTAHWVWCGPNDGADDVYFRYRIGGPAPVESQGKLATRWADLKR